LKKLPKKYPNTIGATTTSTDQPGTLNLAPQALQSIVRAGPKHCFCQKVIAGFPHAGQSFCISSIPSTKNHRHVVSTNTSISANRTLHRQFDRAC
jgi:hypothetical protein